MTIYEQVQADIAARAAKGRATYGDDLRSTTQVDMLQYAYEEALDLAMYLKAEIERRKA